MFASLHVNCSTLGRLFHALGRELFTANSASLPGPALTIRETRLGRTLWKCNVQVTTNLRRFHNLPKM